MKPIKAKQGKVKTTKVGSRPKLGKTAKIAPGNGENTTVAPVHPSVAAAVKQAVGDPSSPSNGTAGPIAQPTNVVPLSAKPVPDQAPIPDPGTQPASKYAAPPPQIIGGGIRVITNVIPKQPRDFCRAFPDRLSHAWVINLAKASDVGKKLYLAVQSVYEAGGLSGLLHRASYSVCVPMIDRDSVPHLWCIAMFNRDGQQTDSYLTAVMAVEKAGQDWHRIWWASGGWNAERARNPDAMSFRLPDNLAAPGIDAWFEGAFPGRIITSIDAPELKRARGEA
jgi:hypothetical protein